MAGTDGPAAILGRGGERRPIGRSDILPAARAGAVVVVPRALQRAGFFETLIGIALSGRICPTPPIAPRADALDVVSFWSPLIETRFERFAGAATKVSWIYAVERLKRRATRVVAGLERRMGGTPLRAVRQALRYRRADRLFDE